MQGDVRHDLITHTLDIWATVAMLSFSYSVTLSLSLYLSASLSTSFSLSLSIYIERYEIQGDGRHDARTRLIWT